MTLLELKNIIRNSGGMNSALESAHRLLKKINSLRKENQNYDVLKQLRCSRDAGDFRGRVLEINFAYQFFQRQQALEFDVKQGMAGDIDFLCKFNDFNIFIEMKLISQSDNINKKIKDQLEESSFFEIKLSDNSEMGDDTSDLMRIQKDILLKSSIRKFNPKPKPNTINFIGIDVSELQLNSIDLADCLLATGGNPSISRHLDNPVYFRNKVVGVFENTQKENLSCAQEEWINKLYKEVIKYHPKEYIHGVIFLFRKPKYTAALSYHLTSIIVVNDTIINQNDSEIICKWLTGIFPKKKF